MAALGLVAVLAGCGQSNGPAASKASDSPAEPPVPSTASSGPATEPPTAASQMPDLQRGPAHPDRATIIDGSWLIGSDYPPALYLTPTAVSRCHWRVVDYATGTLIEDGRYAGPGPVAIWVGDGDLFQSEGCFLWQGYPQLTGSRDSSPMALPSSALTIGDGSWVIGDGVPAGRYRSDRTSAGPCAYQVDRPGDRDDESYASTGSVRSIPAYLDVSLVAGDVFSAKNCGGWQRLD